MHSDIGWASKLDEKQEEHFKYGYNYTMLQCLKFVFFPSSLALIESFKKLTQSAKGTNKSTNIVYASTDCSIHEEYYAEMAFSY